MRKLLGAAMILMTIAGCSAPTGESAFVDRVTPALRPVDDRAGLIDLGRQVCASEDSAKDTTQSWQDAGFRPEEAKALVESAVTTLCPDRKDWLGG